MTTTPSRCVVPGGCSDIGGPCPSCEPISDTPQEVRYAARTTPKIITYNAFPPIPIRQFDWQAWYDGEEDEQMACGHGATEEAAIADLIDNHPRTGTAGGPCKNDPDRPYCKPDQSCCDFCCGN